MLGYVVPAALRIKKTHAAQERSKAKRARAHQQMASWLRRWNREEPVLYSVSAYVKSGDLSESLIR